MQSNLAVEEPLTIFCTLHIKVCCDNSLLWLIILCRNTEYLVLANSYFMLPTTLCFGKISYVVTTLCVDYYILKYVATILCFSQL